MRRSRSWMSPLTCVVLIAGCGGGDSGGKADAGHDAGNDGGDDAGGPPACTATTERFAPAAAVDVLIVVDNSNSMASEQARFGDATDTLVGSLADPERGFPDAHVGVISTSLGTAPYLTCPMLGGDAGVLQAAASAIDPNCTPPSGSFIDVQSSAGVLGGNVANVDTPTSDGTACQGNTDAGGLPVPATGDAAIDVCDIQAALRCIAPLGVIGCSFEQPLEAVRKALRCDDVACTNPGFLRDDAVLVVVVLSDADDCSATDGSIFTNSTATFGALSKYRCFEYGVTCDPPIDRSGMQTLTGCRSKTVEDVGGDPADLYLVPVPDYAAFLSSLRPAGSVVLAAIAGPFATTDSVVTGVMGMNPFVEPSCLGPGGSDSAVPAIRTNELVRGLGGVVLGDVNAQAGICTDDFAPALTAVGDALRGRHPAGYCLGARLARVAEEVPLPIADGSQASCTVTEILNPGASDESRTQIAQCVFDEGPPAACPSPSTLPGTLSGASTSPCWYVCDSGMPAEGGCENGWQLRFCRGAACDPQTPSPLGAEIDAECLACDPKTCACP